jgi:putative flavoprotein involved in K+ transport
MSGPTTQALSTADAEVAVVGGGQTGLAMGYFLQRQGRRFAILERAGEIGPAWRGRWTPWSSSRRGATAPCPGSPSPAIRTATRHVTR